MVQLFTARVVLLFDAYISDSVEGEDKDKSKDRVTYNVMKDELGIKRFFAQKS